ncbi:MAG: hypothetical protein RR745_02725 [Bacilli bacterium]
MKRKYLAILVLFSLLFTGCGVKKIDIKLKDKYRMNITIKGSINDKFYNKSGDILVRSKNEITFHNYDPFDISSMMKPSYYKLDGEYYKDINKEVKYDGKKEFEHFKNYTEMLSKLKKVQKKDKDLIGTTTYEFIPFVIDNKEFNSILKASDIKYKSKNDATGYVYFTPEDELYKIIYIYEEEERELRIELYFSSVV